MANVIKCDRQGCNSEISSTAERIGWYLVHHTRMTAVPVGPEASLINRPYPAGPFHFCSTECLEAWADSRKE